MGGQDAPVPSDSPLAGCGRLAYDLDGVEAHLASLGAERARLLQAIASAEERLETLRCEQEVRDEHERTAVTRLAADAQSRIARLEREFNAAAEALRLAAADEAARIVADARRGAETHAAAVEGRA